MAINIKRLVSRALAATLILASACVAQAATPGPGAWSAQQSWANDTVNGGQLTGFFYWPAAQPAVAGKRGLVLVLHGCQQTAAGDVINSGTDGGYNWKAMAEQYGAVVIAPNATGNVYANHCWDYASTNHNRSSGHDAVLLDVVNRFVSDPRYEIDPNQVYVTGLSSGGGETMALGCLAPDVFAGIGINAGPTPGTTTLQIGAVPSGYTATTAAGKCKAMAGGNTSKFSTQIAGAIWGTNDYTVGQAYGPVATAAFRQIYGGSFTSGGTVAVPGGGSNVPYLDSNGKVRTHEVTVTGMGHSWPAGSGGQNANYVDSSKVNYPAFVMDFWYKNNLRASAVAGPEMTACAANVVSATSATITGSATAANNGSVSAYAVTLAGPTPVNDTAAGSGASFSKTYSLSNGYYTGTVTATDSAGQKSAACTVKQFLVGNAPALPAPGGLSAGTPTATTVVLTWNAVSGATGYNVYRDGVKLTSASVASLSYNATGLTANTKYSFAVSAVGAEGESALSSPVTVTTTSGFVCTATTSSNFAHVQAGRAHTSGGYALANGSNQNMGLYNIFFTKTLAQTSAGYYTVGNCP
jgi:poly(3-hydroxybutyrate) depolymerase